MITTNVSDDSKAYCITLTPFGLHLVLATLLQGNLYQSIRYCIYTDRHKSKRRHGARQDDDGTLDAMVSTVTLHLLRTLDVSVSLHHRPSIHVACTETFLKGMLLGLRWSPSAAVLYRADVIARHGVHYTVR